MNGFALVITLMMLVLAAIIVIALMSSSSLERGTAKSVNDRYQADLAVQNGLEAAKKTLIASPDPTSSITADDGFLVFRVDGTQGPNTFGNKDSYYFLAKARPGAASAVDFFPLFSTPASTPIPAPLPINLSVSPAVQAPAAPTPFPSPAQETFGSTTKMYPQLLPFQQPAYTQWQEIRDPNDTATAPAHTLPYQRYTFWIEDLAGYVDASVAGNLADSGKNKRPLDQSTAAKRYKTSPDEIALFTIFDATPAVDPGNTVAQNLIQNRPLQFTVPTLKQIAPGAGNADVTSPYLAARVNSDQELPLVPFGYGYPDEGNVSKPKLDLNVQVTSGGNTAVQAIATKINDNLPTFGAQRKGGLTGQDYVNTIAASMIDYADTDSDATTGPDYRGLDSYPLVSELYSMKWWNRAAYLNGATYFVHVEMDTWAELWNMTNQSINGSCFLDMVENLPLQAGVNNYTFGIAPGDVQSPSTVTTTYPAGNPFVVNLQANQYGAYHIRHDAFEFDTGISPPLLPPDSTHPMTLTGGTTTNYNLKWSGTSGPPTIIVDHAGTQAGIGVNRIGGTLSGYGQSSKRWSGTYPGFSYTDNPNSSFSQYNLPGDPRSAYFIQSGQIAIAYDNGSSFWERNNRPNVAITNIYQAVKPSAWPDGGHDSAIVGTAPGSNADPSPAPPPGVITESAKAPVTISNSGSYSSLAEIGNIYDPGQWNVAVNASNQWTDISNVSQSSGKYGGGYQLRIGRPEFALFDKPGARAWQLLDLFTTTTRVNSSGLVNVNTASRDVLRSLGAAVLLNRDAAIQPASLRDNLYPPTTSKQADRFADAVIAGRPFLSPAQLSDIKIPGGPAPLFGNPAAWPSSPPTEWNDCGKEEYFAKVFPLATVRSRNFRVFVTGQALDKSGKVLSTVTKVFQIFLKPVRDATGKITSQSISMSYEAILP